MVAVNTNVAPSEAATSAAKAYSGMVFDDEAAAVRYLALMLEAYAGNHAIDPVLIWSIEHAAWWGPSGRGYTRDRAKAGRYPRNTAERIARDANKYRTENNLPPNEAVVPVY
jgi:hypothetical protein